MRPRTGLALALLTVILAGLAVVGLGLGGGTSLTERWVSDTDRDNRINHHPIGVGPDGETIVAPVAAVPGAESEPSDTDCVLASLAPDNGTVLWRHGVPGERCAAHALTEPAVGDVDRDGGMEVAVSTTAETVTLLDGTTGRELARVSQPVYGYGRPAIADVLPTGGREVVASDIAGNVVLVDANGSVTWRQPLAPSFDGSATVWEEPAVADVDGEGDREIAFGTRDGLAVLAANGTVEWVGDGDATYMVAASVAGEEYPRLFTSGGGTVRSIDGASRERVWERDLRVDAKMKAVTAAGSDGDVDVFVSLGNGTAVALDGATGATEWRTQVTTAEDGIRAEPVVASVDGGNDTAVVVATRDGTVTLLDPDTGAERAAYARDVPIWTHPTPADIDGDGTDELLVRYGDGRVVALAIEA